MAAPQVYVFQTLGKPQEPSATGLDELKNLNGFRRALFGVKLEAPDVGVLLTGEYNTPSFRFILFFKKALQIFPG